MTKDARLTNLTNITIASVLLIVMAIIVFSQPSTDNGVSKPSPNATYEINEKPTYADKLLDPVSMFTLALFISTVFLWRSTERLAGLAGIQADDAKKAIAAAQKSADIAERALRASARPHIVIEGIQIGAMPSATSQLSFGWKLVNHGKEIGFIRDCAISLMAFPSSIQMDTYDEVAIQQFLSAKQRITNWPIPPGGYFGTYSRGQAQAHATIPVVDQNRVMAGTWLCYVIGAVSYTDISGIQHEHRFIYLYDVTAKRFTPLRADNWWKYT